MVINVPQHHTVLPLASDTRGRLVSMVFALCDHRCEMAREALAPVLLTHARLLPTAKKRCVQKKRNEGRRCETRAPLGPGIAKALAASPRAKLAITIDSFATTPRHRQRFHIFRPEAHADGVGGQA